MSEENRLRVINAMEKGFQDGGAVDFADASSTVENLAKLLLSSAAFFRSRETVDTALQKLEMTEEEERKFVRGMESLVFAVSFLMPRVLKSAEAIAFSEPGRPKSLSPAKEQEMVNYISRLHALETDMSICKDRAAQKFGISRSTVERIWLDRKKKKRRMPFKEIWQMFFS